MSTSYFSIDSEKGNCSAMRDGYSTSKRSGCGPKKGFRCTKKGKFIYVIYTVYNLLISIVHTVQTYVYVSTYGYYTVLYNTKTFSSKYMYEHIRVHTLEKITC